jgi:hypothetical protein
MHMFTPVLIRGKFCGTPAGVDTCNSHVSDLHYDWRGRWCKAEADRLTGIFRLDTAQRQRGKDGRPRDRRWCREENGDAFALPSYDVNFFRCRILSLVVWGTSILCLPHRLPPHDPDRSGPPRLSQDVSFSKRLVFKKKV